MKKTLIFALLVTVVAFMLNGCSKKSSSDNSGLALLLLMSPSNSTSGSQHDVVSGSQVSSAATSAATSATASALQSAMMGTTPSDIIGKGSGELAKDTLQKTILDVAAKKAISDLGKKADTTSLNNIHITSSITVPGSTGSYTVTPDIYINGSITANLVGSATQFVIVTTMTGTIDVTFTNCTITVFDVYNFITNNVIGFTTVTLGGSFSSTVDSSGNSTMSMTPTTTPTIFTIVSESEGNSTTTTTSSGLTIDGTSHIVDITTKSNEKWSANWTMNTSTFENTYNSVTGTISGSAKGTVDGNSFSYSYSLSGDNLLQYQQQ